MIWLLVKSVNSKVALKDGAKQVKFRGTASASKVLSHRVNQIKVKYSKLSFPASSFEKSRMSLMIVSKASALAPVV
jgi:hypothetical protein